MASRAKILFDEIMVNPVAVIEKMVTDRQQETEYLDFKGIGGENEPDQFEEER